MPKEVKPFPSASTLKKVAVKSVVSKGTTVLNPGRTPLPAIGTILSVAQGSPTAQSSTGTVLVHLSPGSSDRTLIDVLESDDRLPVPVGLYYPKPPSALIPKLTDSNNFSREKVTRFDEAKQWVANSVESTPSSQPHSANSVDSGNYADDEANTPVVQHTPSFKR